MKYILFIGLVCLTSCSLFKAKHEIDDLEKMGTDLGVLEKEIEPNMQLVMAEGEKIIEDLKTMENIAAPELAIIINDGKKLIADFQS